MVAHTWRKAGRCVPSPLVARPSCSLVYVWTPCLSVLASLRTPGPQSGGRAGRLELLVVKNSGHWIVHSHVEVATNEVHVEAHHVRVKPLE